MTVFTSEGTVSTAVLERLNGENHLEKTQLHELLSRQSNCNYPQQILAGLESSESPLYMKILSDVKTTGMVETLLPSATRHFLNNTTSYHGYGSQNFENDVDNPTVILLQGPVENIIKSHQTRTPVRMPTTGPGYFHYLEDTVLKINFKAMIGIYNGVNRIGQGHPSPVFRYSNNDANTVVCNIDLVMLAGTDQIVLPLVNVVFYKDQIENMDMFSVYASHLVQIKMPYNGVVDNNVRTGFYLRVHRTPYVATYNGVQDKVAFIKQGDTNASVIDNTNYLEVIEMGGNFIP